MYRCKERAMDRKSALFKINYMIDLIDQYKSNIKDIEKRYFTGEATASYILRAIQAIAERDNLSDLAIMSSISGIAILVEYTKNMTMDFAINLLQTTIKKGNLYPIIIGKITGKQWNDFYNTNIKDKIFLTKNRTNKIKYEIITENISNNNKNIVDIKFTIKNKNENWVF